MPTALTGRLHAQGRDLHGLHSGFINVPLGVHGLGGGQTQQAHHRPARSIRLGGGGHQDMVLGRGRLSHCGLPARRDDGGGDHRPHTLGQGLTVLGGVAGLQGGQHRGGLDLPDRRQVLRPSRAHEAPRRLGAVMVMRFVSAGGVVVRRARVQVWAQPGQRIGAQDGAVPAPGGR